MRIRTRLIIGFVVVLAATIAMGWYAVEGIRQVSRLTSELFEFPLISSNYARSALSNFVRLELALADAREAPNPVSRAARMGRVRALLATVRDDLAVVESRLLEDDARRLLPRIVGRIEQWSQLASVIGAGAGAADPSRDGRARCSPLRSRSCSAATSRGRWVRSPTP